MVLTCCHLNKTRRSAATPATTPEIMKYLNRSWCVGWESPRIQWTRTSEIILYDSASVSESEDPTFDSWVLRLAGTHGNIRVVPTQPLNLLSHHTHLWNNDDMNRKTPSSMEHYRYAQHGTHWNLYEAKDSNRSRIPIRRFFPGLAPHNQLDFKNSRSPKKCPASHHVIMADP